MGDAGSIITIIIVVAGLLWAIIYGINQIITAPDREAAALEAQRKRIEATGEQILSRTETHFDAITQTQQKLAVALCPHCGAARPKHVQHCPRCSR